ncbi:MAG: hypothetical protein V4484_16965 [Pseudomonadota bacterium]
MNALPALLIAVSSLITGSAALAGPTITLLYEERAPYQMRSGDTVEGNIASPAARAFEAAGIAFVWQASSISRQLHLLRENRGAYCVVGLYKTGERLTYGKFTKPIYRNGPTVALMRRQFGAAEPRTLAQTLSLPGLRLLVRDKYSYGALIDDTLLRVKPDTIAAPLPNSQLADKLLANRADMMFASEEEAATLLRFFGERASQLQVQRFSDAAPGMERHIVCSRNVADDVIARLDRAIGFK